MEDYKKYEPDKDFKDSHNGKEPYADFKKGRLLHWLIVIADSEDQQEESFRFHSITIRSLRSAHSRRPSQAWMSKAATKGCKTSYGRDRWFFSFSVLEGLADQGWEKW